MSLQAINKEKNISNNSFFILGINKKAPPKIGEAHLSRISKKLFPSSGHRGSGNIATFVNEIQIARLAGNTCIRYFFCIAATFTGAGVDDLEIAFVQDPLFYVGDNVT